MTAVADSPTPPEAPQLAQSDAAVSASLPVALPFMPVLELPGWSIAANLTPAEVIAARRAKVVLRFLAGGLVLVLLLCAAGYYLARGKASSAADALAAEQARSVSLQHDQNKYSQLTRLKSTTQAAQQQLSQLMANDAAVAPLLAALEARLPSGGSIAQVSVSLDSAASKTAGDSLATADAKQIGTISFSGKMPSAAAATDFVKGLTAKPISGLYLPYPGSTTVNPDGTAQYSLSASLTAALLTHQYAVKGSK